MFFTFFCSRNEEAATKGTGAGIVCLDQIIKHDRSTGTRQTIHLKNRSEQSHKTLSWILILIV